ncbi:MAG TPA: AbrB/MazE/SpoVT family DNA-binding domain-containing protein [Candidatus Saccharimonadales bacterium]|nr:AbrB/MazE/SpoVT family DNA-binding domain-containing protein [Candidatus Saccharimonadales bacterium]
MTQKIITIGNSLGIILPQSIRKNVDLHMGDEVEVKEENNKILVSKVKKKQPKLTAKFAQMVDDFMTEHEDVLQELANK